MQGILSNSIERADLNKRQFLAEFEHSAADDIRQLDGTEIAWFKEMPWTIPRSLHMVSKLGKQFFDQLFHVAMDRFTISGVAFFDNRALIHFRYAKVILT